MALCGLCGWSAPEPPSACARGNCGLGLLIADRRMRLAADLARLPSEPVRRSLEYANGRDPTEGISDNQSNFSDWG